MLRESSSLLLRLSQLYHPRLLLTSPNASYSNGLHRTRPLLQKISTTLSKKPCRFPPRSPSPVRSLGFTDLSIPHLASLQTAITRLRLVALFADASELSLPLVEDVIYLLQSSVQRERVTGCDTHCVEQVTQVLFPAFETAFRSLESASDHAWLVVSEKTLTLLDWWE